jgi:chromate reductase, NAD(P)H dehydrogenase (quinone)
MRILAISGSLRRESHNSALLRAAARTVPPGVEFVAFHDLRRVPPYDQDRDIQPAPAAVQRLREAIESGDAVLLSTLEYNSSIPGQLKNALDWASRPFPANAFRGKPVAVIGGSKGMFGAAWAQIELRRVLAAIGARVIDGELLVAAMHQAFGPEDQLLDRAHHDRLVETTRLLVEAAGGRSAGRAA